MHLRIGHAHAFGHQIGRLVVVGDVHLDARLHDLGHLVLAGDAAVHRDDHIGGKLASALEGGRGDAVALLEAAGNEREGAGAQRPQTPGEHRGGRDAVQIEVAEHDDALLRLDGGDKAVGHLGKTGDVVGVRPVAVERRREEALGGAYRGDAATNERGGDETGQPQVVLETRHDGGVGFPDAELGGHGDRLPNMLKLLCLAVHFRIKHPACHRRGHARYNPQNTSHQDIARKDAGAPEAKTAPMYGLCNLQ